MAYYQHYVMSLDCKHTNEERERVCTYECQHYACTRIYKHTNGEYAQMNASIMLVPEYTNIQMESMHK